MKQFIFNTLKFIFPIVFILVFSIATLELYIHTQKEKILSEDSLENVFKCSSNAYNWIYNIEKDSLILLTGSSSVRYGLSCSELNNLSNNPEIKYVNLAMDARCPVETYFILKGLSLKSVKSVYLGLDPWIYAKRYYKHRNKIMYLDFDFATGLEYMKEHDSSFFLQRYRVLFKSKKRKKCSIHDNNTIPADFGSVALNKKASNFDESIDNWFQIEKYGWSELQFQYLAKIQDLCNKNNVEFSVFIPPKRSDYSNTYATKCKEIHIDYVRNLENVGLSCPIFGIFNQLDDLGDSSFFVESYHLNQDGQKYYSALFYDMTQQKNKKFTIIYEWIE